MKKNTKVILALGLIFCLFGISIAQQMYQIKKKTKKSNTIETTITKKDSIQISDSLKQEIELQRGLLLRDTSSTKY